MKRYILVMWRIRKELNKYGTYSRKMVGYLSKWMDESKVPRYKGDILYNISNISDLSAFIYRLYLLTLLDEGLMPILGDNSRLVLDQIDYKFDIGDSIQIFYDIIEKKEQYGYQFVYSDWFKCKKCGGPCEISNYQVRRADEAMTQVVTCVNCGYKRTSCE